MFSTIGEPRSAAARTDGGRYPAGVAFVFSRRYAFRAFTCTVLHGGDVIASRPRRTVVDEKASYTGRCRVARTSRLPLIVRTRTVHVGHQRPIHVFQLDTPRLALGGTAGPSVAIECGA